MSPLVFITVAAVVAGIPGGLWGVSYMWGLYRDERASGGERETLTLLLAISVTIAYVGVLVLLAPVWSYIVNAPVEVRRVTGQAILLAIDALVVTMMAVPLYLRFRT